MSCESLLCSLLTLKLESTHSLRDGQRKRPGIDREYQKVTKRLRKSVECLNGICRSELSNTISLHRLYIWHWRTADSGTGRLPQRIRSPDFDPSHWISFQSCESPLSAGELFLTKMNPPPESRIHREACDWRERWMSHCLSVANPDM
jgi:hypothetical protein